MNKELARKSKEFWLDSARRMRVFRDAEAGDPTVEFCVKRARMFSRLLWKREAVSE